MLDKRSLTRRTLLARGLALGSGGLLLAGCARRDSELVARAGATPTAASALSAPRTGGALRIGRAGDILAMGAPYLLTAANAHLFTLVYDTLVSYDPQLNPRPKLATGWEWSPDSRRLTLKLRPGVKFHTGRPFTSDDAKFNLERVREPTVGSPWRNYGNLMRVSAPDPLTLVIDYDAPVKSSFDALSATFMADPLTLDDTNAGRGFVGTGPFRFQEWVPGDHLTVTRNSDYWQPGKPYLDQVELRILPNAQSGLAWLESGYLDWMSGVPGQDARRLQGDATYNVMLTASGGTFYYLGMDLAMPELADPRVRQAFSHALNRERIVDTALSGFGRATSIAWPRHSPGYDAALDRAYTFDLGKARQLLDAANWDTTTTVPLVVSRLLGLNTQMAQIFQADLATIGVKLAVQEIDSGDLISRLAQGRFGSTWLTSMSFMNLSPATFLTSALTVRVPNASHFVTPRYKDLIDQINAETDDKKLKTQLREVTQIMLDEAFIAPIAEGSSLATGPEVARNSVHDAAWDAFGLFGYEDIWLDR
jgi:peptide/nickel transport system substrate-binding protein